MRSGSFALFLRSILVVAAVAFATGCGGGPFIGNDGGGGGGGGGGTGAAGATLVNMGDAAPDRVLAVSLNISDIKLNNNAGGSTSVLQVTTGTTVEMSHLGASFAPINLTSTSTASGTYTGATITVSSASVTWVDDAGAIQQDTAPTLNGSPLTVTFASPVLLTGTSPTVLNLEFDPNSLSFPTPTTAQIDLAFTGTLGPPATSGTQNDATGAIKNIVGMVTADPQPGSNRFQLTYSQASKPITIGVDSSTLYLNQVNGFGALFGKNIVQVDAQFQTDGTMLAKTIYGENAGTGKITGGDLQGIITAVGLTGVDTDTFNLREHVANAAVTAPSVGTNVPITDLTVANAQMTIDIQDVDLSNLSGPNITIDPSFDVAHLRPGQEVSVIYANAAATAKPDALRLKLQSMSGTVGAISNGNVTGQQKIVLTLSAESALHLMTCAAGSGVTCQTQITVVQQPGTDISLGGPSPGNPLRARGLLFYDDVTDSYFLIADRFTP